MKNSAINKACAVLWLSLAHHPYGRPFIKSAMKSIEASLSRLKRVLKCLRLAAALTSRLLMAIRQSFRSSERRAAAPNWIATKSFWSRHRVIWP